MNGLIIHNPIFYMSPYRAGRHKPVMDNVKIITKEMTDEFGILFENGKILVVYFDEQEE